MVYTWSQSEASLSNATVNKLNINCVRKLYPLCIKGISDLVFVEKDGNVHLYSSLIESSSGSKLQELNSSRGYVF